jgi:hypothetical protein
MASMARRIQSFPVPIDRSVTRTNWLLALAVVAVTCATTAAAQATDALPFGAGERLTYRIRSAKFGTVGSAVMALSGPVDVRGSETILASLDASAGIAFLRGHDATRSWFDPLRMTSLRYQKIERRPFSSNVDSVEIYPGLRHWEATHGDSGTSPTDFPLDELSFLYFLRTVTLLPDSLYSFDRSFDRRRLPTTVRVVTHEHLKTAVGEFDTIKYEVSVTDARNFALRNVLYIWISEDRCRLPVRIESVMSVLGNGIMTLETATTPGCRYLVAK